ncbi:unnamed protein product [Sphagnum balticum]
MKFMRAGSGKLVQNLPGVVSAPDSITVSSEEFAYGDPMPARFSHMGGNLSPALSWAGVPPEAKEIVLIVEDPDAPMPNPFVHAIAYGMDPSVKCLSEGILLGRHLGQASPHCLKIGKNTFGNTGYYGPAPIPEHGESTTCSAQPSAADQKLADKNMSEYFRLIKAGEEDDALKCVSKAISLFPTPSSYRERAGLYMSLNRNKEAMDDAKMAIKLDPNDPETMRILARVLGAQGKRAESLKAYSDAIARKPGNGVFRFDRARLYEQMHEYAKAAADYSVTIANAEKQNRAKYLEDRGLCYIQTKEYKKAISDFTVALACSAGRSKLLRSRALAYKLMGDAAMEKKDLKAAAEMDETFEPPTTLGQGR